VFPVMINGKKKMKIKVPEKLDEAQMNEIGKKNKAMSWTDKELGEQIAALSLTISYLQGRKDCGMIVSGLLRELSSFEDFKFSRECKVHE